MQGLGGDGYLVAEGGGMLTREFLVLYGNWKSGQDRQDLADFSGGSEQNLMSIVGAKTEAEC